MCVANTTYFWIFGWRFIYKIRLKLALITDILMLASLMCISFNIRSLLGG